MPELSNIKDMTPNKNLITDLERLLSEAKAGNLRSIQYITAYDCQGVSNGWALDGRSSSRLMLAEMVLAQEDFKANILIADGYGRLFTALKDGIE